MWGIIIYIYCPVWRETWRFVQPRKFMSPEGEARGWHEFSGLNKSSCLPTNWAINVYYYTESRRFYYQGNMHWIEVFHTLAFHSQWERLGTQNMYYDVTALATAERCAVRQDRETWRLEGDNDLFSLHVTSLDQSYFFIRHINYMRYNNILCTFQLGRIPTSSSFVSRRPLLVNNHTTWPDICVLHWEILTTKIAITEIIHQ